MKGVLTLSTYLVLFHLNSLGSLILALGGHFPPQIKVVRDLLFQVPLFPFASSLPNDAISPMLRTNSGDKSPLLFAFTLWTLPTVCSSVFFAKRKRVRRAFLLSSEQMEYHHQHPTAKYLTHFFENLLWRNLRYFTLLLSVLFFLFKNLGLNGV